MELLPDKEGPVPVPTPKAARYETGERLKAALGRFGKMQKELAEHLHCSANNIAMVCNGHRRLTTDRAREICEWLPGLRTDYLLCRDEYMTEGDYLRSRMIDEVFSEGWREAEAMELLLRQQGYTFQYDEEKTGPVCYVCREGEGIPLMKCSAEEIERLEQEIGDYAAFRLARMIERSKEHGKD